MWPLCWAAPWVDGAPLGTPAKFQNSSPAQEDKMCQIGRHPENPASKMQSGQWSLIL